MFSVCSVKQAPGVYSTEILAEGSEPPSGRELDRVMRVTMRAQNMLREAVMRANADKQVAELVRMWAKEPAAPATPKSARARRSPRP